MLNGEPLRNRKGPVRNVIRALDMTAMALAGGKPVPEAAAELMARPMIPRWLYLVVGNWGWKRQARQFGTSRRLGERPWTDRNGEVGCTSSLCQVGPSDNDPTGSIYRFRSQTRYYQSLSKPILSIGGKYDAKDAGIK